MHVLFAVLIGVGVAAAGAWILRGLMRPAPPVPEPERAVPVPARTRITFWCETCGSELLLLRRGTEAAPRHCGEPMLRREELAHG